MDERLREWRRLQRDRKIAPVPEGLADDVWRGLEHEPAFERPDADLEWRTWRLRNEREMRIITGLRLLWAAVVVATAVLAVVAIVAQLVALRTCGS